MKIKLLKRWFNYRVDKYLESSVYIWCFWNVFIDKIEKETKIKIIDRELVNYIICNHPAASSSTQF